MRHAPYASALTDDDAAIHAMVQRRIGCADMPAYNAVRYEQEESDLILMCGIMRARAKHKADISYMLVTGLTF